MNVDQIIGTIVPFLPPIQVLFFFLSFILLYALGKARLRMLQIGYGLVFFYLMYLIIKYEGLPWVSVALYGSGS